MKNIWETVKKPVFILAPMENVTDTVFRQIVNQCGKPDIYFTEFTNVDGILSKGFERVAVRLQHTKIETPLIAQIWGNNPDSFYKAVKKIAPMGFSGIDINMGCPDRSIVKKGSCSALINNQTLAKEIILATKEAAGNLPVSVKTRCGTNQWITEEWLSFLLTLDLPAITLHGRIAKEMSHFPARWEEIGKAVQLRNSMQKSTLIIGNGDVMSYEDGLEKVKTYGVDGVMIGRGVFHNLWIFNPTVNSEAIPIQEKLSLLIKHITLFENTWEGRKPIEILKKFYKIYVLSMPNATEVRTRLMEYKTAEETIAYLRTIM